MKVIGIDAILAENGYTYYLYRCTSDLLPFYPDSLNVISTPEPFPDVSVGDIVLPFVSNVFEHVQVISLKKYEGEI